MIDTLINPIAIPHVCNIVNEILLIAQVRMLTIIALKLTIAMVGPIRPSLIALNANNSAKIYAMHANPFTTIKLS